MRLHAICGYRSYGDCGPPDWTGEEYRALSLVKAIKREPFKGYDDWKTPAGVVHRVQNTEAGQRIALLIAASKMAQRLTAIGYPSASLVPIPSSKHTVPGAEFTGSRLTAAIQKAAPQFRSFPVLRFDQPLPKSAGGGGTRRPELILPHLRGNGQMPPPPVVLVDDVFTTGGHMRAAALFLRQHGFEVEDCIVVARTVWERPPDLFNLPVEEVDV